MSFSFSDLRKEVLESVFLSSNFFGEEATVSYREGGAAIPVSCKVSYGRNQQTDQSQTHTETERIEVILSRDPTSLTGGIDRPRTGMRFTRRSDRDPDRGPYVFTGEIVGETPEKWCLVFERKRKLVQGRTIG